MYVLPEEGFQFINVYNNRWVFSALAEGKVYVFDSLQSSGVSDDLEKKLWQLYSKQLVADGAVTLVPLSRQHNGNGCGLYAIAVAFDLL